MENVLVGVDFCGYTDTIIDHTLTFVKVFNSKIWLLHVAAPDPDFVSYKAGPQSERDLRAEKLRKENKQLLKYADYIRNQGFEAEGLLVSGTTNEIILEMANKLNIELIVVGHREHGILYNLFFGSTSKEIIEKSNIPILVIPTR